MATTMGVVAIVLWSCTVAVARELSETVGTTTASAIMLLGGGLVGCGHAALRHRLGAILALPSRYLLGCGGLFVTYMVCLYLAIGLASSRQQAIEVGIINYLWPGLTLLFAVPLLGTRVRWTFAPGVVLAFGGAALAPLRPGEYSLGALGQSLLANPLPYVLALTAAVSWALYSVLSRRLAAEQPTGAVPIFAVAAGLVLAGLRLVLHEQSHFGVRAAVELGFMALFPVLLAYGLWDRAMRRGNVTLVAALSYFAPLLSTVVSLLYLEVKPSPTLWPACALVIAGALVCERSVVRAAA